MAVAEIVIFSLTSSILPIPLKVMAPNPLGVKLIPILVSPPVAEILGLLPVAAFATVNSFTAEAVVVNIISSLPLASSITSIIGVFNTIVFAVPLFIVGEVNVLFVKVWVACKFTSAKSTTSVPFK